MPKYNPNSMWEGKKKEVPYTVPEKTAPATVRPATATPKTQATQSQTPGQGTAPTKKDGSAQNPFFKKTPLENFDESPTPKSNIFLWLAITIGVLFIGGITAYLLFFRPGVGPNVSIEFSKPDQVLVGDPFILSASLSNYSSGILKNASLSVFLPDNVSFIGQSVGQRVMEQVVGDLGPGSINKQDLNLIVTGDPNSVKHITTKLTYSTDANSKAQFETDGGVDIVVGGPAISLNFDAPSSIFSGQDFDITVSYNNNTSHSFNNVQLAMQYPPVFVFSGSTMTPNSSGKNLWNLGTIPAAGTGSLTITGNVVGPNNAIYSLTGNLTGQVQGDTYPLTSQSASLAIGSSPLSLSVTLNNSGDYVSKAGDALNYVLTYTNMSNVTFQNVTLTAGLLGAMFDFSSLKSDGAFNSIKNTVTWSGANTPALLNIAPGQTGSVSLGVGTKSSFPIHLLSDKNYTLKLSAQISSPTVPPGTAASSTVTVTNVENKVGGAISLATRGYWRDAASGILNSGLYPPKVNQKTQYTIHWAITNYSTDVQAVTVSAYLQSGTTCTGEIKSNLSTAPICNAANGLITWTIPNIPATTGIASPAAEAIFQVENTPAVNQVDQSVTLLGPTTLQATDVFTNSPLQSSAAAVTTDIPDDRTIGTQNRRVTQ